MYAVLTIYLNLNGIAIGHNDKDNISLRKEQIQQISYYAIINTNSDSKVCFEYDSNIIKVHKLNINFGEGRQQRCVALL